MPAPHIQCEINANLKKLAKTDMTAFEAIRQAKDGTSLEVSAHGFPVRNNGGVEAFIIIYMNISTRKQIERSLQESQERFSLAIDATDEGLWDWNLKTDEVYFSPRYYTMLGYEPEDFPPRVQTWIDLLHPDDKDKVITVNEFSKSNSSKTFEIEFRLRTKAGNWAWILGKGKVVSWDENGIPQRMIGTHSDISERKRNEQIIKENVEFNSNLLKNAPHPIVVYGPDLTIQYVNPAFQELTNFNKDELIGIRPPFPWWLEGNQENMNLLLKAMNSESQKHEMLFYTKDRLPFWVELSPRAIKAQGKIKYYISNWVDITDRKQTSQELKKEKRYWQQLFENSPEGIVLCDEEDRVLRANQAFYNMFGYEEKEVLGKVVDDLVASPEGYYREAREYSRSAREGIKVSTDTVRFRKDRTHLPVSILGVPFRLNDGSTFGYGIYRDISARKKAEEALDTEHHYLLNLFEGAPEGIILCDQEQKVIRGNLAFCNMFGYTRREIIGRYLDDLVTNSDEMLKEAQNITKGVINGKSLQVDTIRTRKDGSEIPVSILGVPFRVGNEYAIYGIYRDITDRKEAEEKLKESYRQLAKGMEGTINTMAKVVETRDPYTAGHQLRVAELAYAIAEEMGLPAEQKEAIRFAAMIHDIGKISIPTEILSKPGKLSDLEFRLIKNHPLSAYEILKDIDFPWPIARTVLQHHERIDGSGYPNGHTGEEILLEARILAVADVVEAMSSNRPYRPGLGLDKALAEIQDKSGIFYDREVADSCISVFKKRGFTFTG